MGKKLKSDALLMLTALIWGTSFVAQKEGMDLIGPLAFNGIRTLIGALVLIPVILLLNGKKGEDTRTPEEKKTEKKLLIIGGVCCGLVLCLAGNVQQIGIFYTSVSHSGFITAMYVVIVPLLGLFLKKRVPLVIWCCVAASAVGLYLLCIPASGFGHVNKGDLIILLCAVLFAVHILVIDYFSPKVDGTKMSCIQFFVAGILSLIFMAPVDSALGFDLPTVSTVIGSWLPILYSGVLSCGVAYTLQIVAQKDADPTVASMILCLESVFALIAGMIILGEMMSVREVVGCVLMFAAIVVANLPTKQPDKL
ncbi:MAG: DMT family transporter [Clostridiales bacterium]|nr:DMT family transporter [Clostridiales bacterium]MDD7035869.1 DMT family transporter [Bacillota bacterium]MDY2920109.1 DMT family transporter [Lentihominibacter sp.]